MPFIGSRIGRRITSQKSSRICVNLLHKKSEIYTYERSLGRLRDAPRKGCGGQPHPPTNYRSKQNYAAIGKIMKVLTFFFFLVCQLTNLLLSNSKVPTDSHSLRISKVYDITKTFLKIQV